MPIDPEKERALFFAVADLPAADRGAFLDQTCDGDAALRQRLDKLLQARDHEDDFLNPNLANEHVTAALNAAADQEAGTSIGPYKLLEKIGTGGMGVVWRAEQVEPVRRTVALKVIKAGMDSAHVLARFDVERQALALMDHPGIARVLDAGATPQGRPFFVMELVQGIPITEYCNEHQLALSQRLDLFIDVCQAIQHAHQKGVIHRDIKPGNVLVGSHDGKRVPKVIDFGVAKATGEKLSKQTVVTGFGGIIGTLEYMSPEQAQFNAVDIDTRSDIYSLGVLLYELLTGTTPITRERLEQTEITDALRLIREEEPARPSTRVQAAETLPTVAAQRGIEPTRLASTLQGDLDWIVMKALDKDRTRRYETATALARDIERHLHFEPVEASPPSALYRIRKFARKYRAPLRAAVLALLLALVGGLFSAWQAVRATIAEGHTRKALEATEEYARQLKEEKLASDRMRYVADMRLAQHAWDLTDMGRLTELVEVHRTPPSEDLDLRGFEWWYWNRLSHEELLNLRGHANRVGCVTFSPDGKMLATASEDRTIKLWDAATGQERRTLAGHKGNVYGVAFSPDGQRLASACEDKIVKVWDVATGHVLLTLADHPDGVHRAVFSTDGKLLATACFDKAARLWDAQSGQLLHTFKGHASGIYSVALSPDGLLLASASEDQTVKLWDTTTGKELRTLTGHAFVVYSVAFSPDGKLLASCSFDTTVKIWDAATGKEVRTLKGHSEMVFAAVFSPDNQRLASASADKTIKLWDVATGLELRTLKGHTQLVHCVSFSSDGRRLASSSFDNTAKVWDASTTQGSLTLQGHTAGVYSVAFRPDSPHLATGSWDKTIRIWNCGTGQELHVLKGHASVVHGVSYSPDGKRLASASWDKTLRLWDADSGRELAVLKGHTEMVQCVTFSPDGQRLASGGWDKTVRIWDASTGRMMDTLKGHTGCVHSVTFCTDGRYFASAGYDKAIKLWNPATGQELRTLNGHTSEVRTLSFSKDGRILASGSWDKTVKLWDTATGRELRTLQGHTSYIECVTFAPDGRRLCSASDDQTVKVWDVTTGQELLTLRGQMDNIHAVAFSLDGRRLASASADKTVLLRDAAPREQHTLDDKPVLVQRIPRLPPAGPKPQPSEIESFEEKFKIQRAQVGADHVATLETMTELGTRYRYAGRLDNALAFHQETLQRCKTKLGPDDALTLLNMEGLGLTNVMLKQFDDAESVLRECLAIRQTKEPNGWQQFDTASVLGACLLGQKRFADAEAMLLIGHDGMTKHKANMPASSHARIVETVAQLVALYEATEQPQKALKWRQELEAAEAGLKLPAK